MFLQGVEHSSVGKAAPQGWMSQGGVLHQVTALRSDWEVKRSLIPNCCVWLVRTSKLLNMKENGES